MSMYDMIGGHQVKCFPKPLYYGKNLGIGCMDGNLRNFKSGDQVPHTTWWYKYGEDFNIIGQELSQSSSCFGYETVMIKIRGGKVTEVKTDEFEESDFVDIPFCVSDTGEKLNIRSVHDFQQFLKNCIKYESIERSAYLGSGIVQKEYDRFMNGSTPNDPQEEAKIQKRKKELEEEYKTVHAKEDAVMKSHYDDLIAPYVISEDDLQKQKELGMTLACIQTLTKRLTNEFTRMENKMSYDGLKDCCDRYDCLQSEESGQVYQKFLEWSGAEEQEVNEVVEKAEDAMKAYEVLIEE